MSATLTGKLFDRTAGCVKLVLLRNASTEFMKIRQVKKYDTSDVTKEEFDRLQVLDEFGKHAANMVAENLAQYVTRTHVTSIKYQPITEWQLFYSNKVCCTTMRPFMEKHSLTQLQKWSNNMIENLIALTSKAKKKNQCYVVVACLNHGDIHTALEQLGLDNSMFPAIQSCGVTVVDLVDEGKQTGKMLHSLNDSALMIPKFTSTVPNWIYWNNYPKNDLIN